MNISMPESIKTAHALEQAAAAMPILMQSLEESAGRIADALDVVADIQIRRARADGLIAPDEYQDEEEESGEENAPA